ncbi:universal stress protein [Gordonia rhizosphera]|uniref:UspA domain-containing protein n=1 Tax=Gordonia rhizosphera NBRC 16068 TaxID=1108045 RepID=K6WNM7_9ACTN|nr:universal stress protein [Gordonia rhizosphera]GAB93732.1 hypothetical protein GORHZ_243_00060 [Gordonia rhizosphera NBRC 16068]
MTTYRGRWEQVDGVSCGRGPVIVGYTGTDASLRAVTASARTLDPTIELVLVCAVTRRRRRAQPTTFLHDALKSEAYLLTPEATTDELLRHAAETAQRECARQIRIRTETGDPVTVLARAAADLDASAVILGMNGPGPGALARALRRRVGSEADLFVTDGTTFLYAASGTTVTAGAGRSSSRPVWDPTGVGVAHG